MAGLTLSASLVLLAAALLADSSWRLGPLAGRVPIAILVPTLLLLIVQLGREALGRRSAPTVPESVLNAAIVGPVVWLATLVGAILLVGMPLGVGGFLLTWLIGRARQAWWRAGSVSLAMTVLIAWVLPLVTTAPLPAGLLTRWLKL
jgi:hypothetical protein